MLESTALVQAHRAVSVAVDLALITVVSLLASIVFEINND